MKPSIAAAALLSALALPSAAHAGQIVRHLAPIANAPILLSVTVPAGAETLYLSGQVPAVADPKADAATIAAYGDTKTQAVGVFRKIEALLKAEGYGLGDVVKLTVFLAGDPAKSGKLDFAGFSEAYGQFFGTAQQPAKVARSTVQVAALANPGYLVEIEATAAKVR
jgi:enamine deaminase RidA (YjgF/YER057c/UK114 family)